MAITDGRFTAFAPDGTSAQELAEDLLRDPEARELFGPELLELLEGQKGTTRWKIISIAF